MQAGKLRDVVEIQKRVRDSIDATGHHVTRWVTFLQPFCEVKYSMADESYQDGREVQVREIRITLRYCDDIDPSMRVLDGKVYYDIIGITHDVGRKQVTVLSCKEITESDDRL